MPPILFLNDLLQDHFSHHNYHTLLACVSCFAAGYVYNVLMYPRLEYLDRLVSIYDQCGDGKEGNGELAFVEEKLINIETDLLNRLPESIATWSRESSRWGRRATSLCFIQAIVLLWLYTARFLGVGLGFYVFAVASMLPAAVALQKSAKNRRAASHFSKLKDHIEKPSSKASRPGIAKKMVVKAAIAATSCARARSGSGSSRTEAR